MAKTLELKWASKTVDLLAGSDSGCNVRSWRPRSGRFGSKALVTETMGVQVEASSDDNLATYIQALDEMGLWAQRYIADPTSEYPVWLHAQMEGETGERRALVHSLSLEWMGGQTSEADIEAKHKARLRLKIEREPWWEQTAHEFGQVKAESGGTLIAWDYTAGGNYDLGGDVPARVEDLIISSEGASSNGGELARLWMGFRSDHKHPEIENFVGVWECEDGTLNDTPPEGDSGITIDNSSHPNNTSPGSGSGEFVVLSESDLDWDADDFQEVLEIKLSDVSANEQDQYGEFLWMLRHKVAAGSCTWDVQLRWGYSGMADDEFVRGRVVELSNTSWDYKEMGRYKIPARDLHALTAASLTEANEATYAVQIWARRTSGSANLHLDCLCLVPMDEGWLVSDGFTVAASADGDWIYGCGVDGAEQAAAYNYSTQLTHMAAVHSSGFEVPRNDGRLYVLYAGALGHNLTDEIGCLELNFFQRWANLMGSDDLHADDPL